MYIRPGYILSFRLQQKTRKQAFDFNDVSQC